jgi:hypothetical protein
MAKTCREWKINSHFYSYNIRFYSTVWLTKNSRIYHLVYELQIINFYCRHFSQRIVNNKSRRLHHPSTPCLHPSIIKAHSGVGHWWISMRLHSVSYQKTVFFSVQSQRTSNLTDMLNSTLISAPKCVSSNGSVYYHHLQLYSPEGGFGLHRRIYYFFKNVSVQYTNRWQYQLHFEYPLTFLNCLKQN